MNLKLVSIFIIGIIIFTISAGCSAKYNPGIEVSIGERTPTVTPTSIPTSDVEIVKAGILNYYAYKSLYGVPSTVGITPENETMQNLALENAEQGTNSLKIKANSPEQAIKLFETYEDENIGDAGVFWKHNWGVSGAGIYGVGVYKISNQYNICIVFAVPQKSTTELNSDGVYILVEHPDEINYLWSDV